MAAVIWSGVRLWLRMSSGSALMTMVRALPPMGGGDDSPATLEKLGLTHTLARSCNSLLDRLGLLRVNCPTGRVDASKRMIMGGGVPGGISVKPRLVWELTPSAASPILFPPSKLTFIIPR